MPDRRSSPCLVTRRFLTVTLAGALVLTSAFLATKHLGGFGAAVVLCGIAISPLCIARLVSLLPRDRAAARWAGIAVATVLIATALLVHPSVNSTDPSRGSDGDDALRIAATRLLRGEYPYLERTYLDNPISPLPGGVIVATPFALLHNMALQNAAAWSLFFVVLVRIVFRDWRVALTACAVPLVGSLGSMHNFITGQDYLANSLAVLLPSLVLIYGAPHRAFPALILLGLALAWRPNFFMVVPLITAAVYAERSAREAIRAAVVMLSVSLLVTVPIFLWDPQNFSPLHVTDKLERFNSVIPFFSPLVIGATALSAIAFALASLRVRGVGNVALFGGVILAFPAFCGGVAELLGERRTDLNFFLYGLFSLPWFAVAWANTLESERNTDRGPDGEPC